MSIEMDCADEGEQMTFEQRLADEVAEGNMTAAERDDLLEQKALFDKLTDVERAAHKGKQVGFVAGEMLVCGGLHEILAEAKSRHPGRMLFFEQV